MMTAKSAREHAEIRAKQIYERELKIKKYMDEIEAAINKAVNKGKMETTIYIDINTSDEVRSMIREVLEKVGYRVSMAKHAEENKKMGAHVVDQGYYYDEVLIDWK